MNPYCRRAVAQGVTLARDTGGTCTVVTLGPPGAEDVLREAVAWGADGGLHACDPAFAGSDTLATARALAAALRAEGPFDLSCSGRNSIDGETGQVGPELAQLLDLPFAAGVRRLRDGGPSWHLELEHDDGTQEVELALPALLTVAERLCDPCKVDPAGRAAVAPERIRRLGAGHLGAGPWGDEGSPTVVGATRSLEHSRTPLVLDGPLAAQVDQAVRLLRTRGALTARPEPPAAPPAAARTVVRGGSPVLTVLIEPGRPRVTEELLGAAAGWRRRWAPSSRPSARRRWTPSSSSAPAPRSWWHSRHPPRWRPRTWPWRWPTTWRGPRRGRCSPPARPSAARSPGAPRRPPARAWWATPSPSRRATAGWWRPSPRSPARWWPTSAAAAPRRWSRSGPACFPLRRRGDRVTRWSRRGPAHTPTRARPRGAARRRRGDAGPGGRGRRCGLGGGARRVRRPEPLGGDAGCGARGHPQGDRQGMGAAGSPVGITGRSIAPRLYIAIGLSGKFNHTVGVRAAGTILAINTDRQAPVFAQCDIGIVGDWREVVPLLHDALRRAEADDAVGADPIS